MKIFHTWNNKVRNSLKISLIDIKVNKVYLIDIPMYTNNLRENIKNIKVTFPMSWTTWKSALVKNRKPKVTGTTKF